MSHLKPKTGLGALVVAFFAFLAVSCDEPLIPEDFAFSFSPKEVTIPATGGEAEVAFNAPIAWKASTDAAWIQFAPAEGEPGDVVLRVTVSENPAKDARSATITVSLPEAEYKETIQVTQQAHDPAINLSAETIESPAEGDSKTVTVQATVNWTASSDADWLTASPASGGFGETQVAIGVAENPYPQDRVGNLTFSGEGIVKTVTVTQHSTAPWLTVSTGDLSSSYEGGRVEFTVSGNVEWTASSDADWFTANPAKGGFGETKVVVSVNENKAAYAREASILVQGPDNLIHEITVNQDAAPAWISVSAQDMEFSSAGGSVEFTVESNSEWGVASSADWAAVTVSGNKVKLTVAVNDSPERRNCEIVFTAQNETAVIQIVQKGRGEVGGITGDIGDWGDGGEAEYGR